MAFSVDAKVLNVSRSGIAVQSNFQLMIGRKYFAQVGPEGSAVSATGTVRRCSLKKTQMTENGDVEPVYEAGIEFDDVLTEGQSKLMPLVARNASLQLKPRLYGRFRPDQYETVTLEANARFEVKRISLSGILVETDATSDVDTIVSLELEIEELQIACAGRVADAAKIQDEEGNTRFQLGMEFLELSESDREILKAFLLQRVARDF